MIRAVLAAAIVIMFAAAPARADDAVTQHVVHLPDGSSLPYTATAGTLTLNDGHDQPTANVFYVAYTTGERSRPVTFLYNGGPGSASLWLHIGAFGPRRLVISDTSFQPPAANRIVDNPETLLDTSDLVFIDAVGTGFSAVTGTGTNADFWGVDQDIGAFEQFIRRWIVANDRENSPKFLLGESYGTFRSAGLVGRLQRDGIAVNGVIMLGTVLDYADDFGTEGDENIPDAFAVPTEAAVAWYHKKGDAAAASVADAIAAARTFTTAQLLPALLRSTPLDTPAEAQLAARMHELIGLDPTYLQRADLRVAPDRFESELLRDSGQVIGRFDGRVTGIANDRNAGSPAFDPSYESVAPAFTSAFLDYVRNELHYVTTRMYRTLPGDVVANWDFRRSGFTGRALAPTTIPDLRAAMQANPHLRVFAAGGMYDLATPFYAWEYELSNVGLDPAVTARISESLYPSGHMIYLNDEARRALRADLSRFYASAVVP